MKAPKGYRLLRRGETPRKTDLLWTINFDGREPDDDVRRWRKPDSYDMKEIIGNKNLSPCDALIPVARKIRRARK